MFLFSLKLLEKGNRTNITIRFREVAHTKKMSQIHQKYTNFVCVYVSKKVGSLMNFRSLLDAIWCGRNEYMLLAHYEFVMFRFYIFKVILSSALFKILNLHCFLWLFLFYNRSFQTLRIYLRHLIVLSRWFTAHSL